MRNHSPILTKKFIAITQIIKKSNLWRAMIVYILKGQGIKKMHTQGCMGGVIRAENDINRLNSNFSQGCGIYFLLILLRKGINPSLLLPATGKRAGQNGLSSLGWESLWEMDNLEFKCEEGNGTPKLFLKDAQQFTRICEQP